MGGRESPKTLKNTLRERSPEKDDTAIPRGSKNQPRGGQGGTVRREIKALGREIEKKLAIHF